MKLSFMTWVCPEWRIEEIVKAAKKYGYDGVEFRVQCKQAHQVDLEMGESERRNAKEIFENENLAISCLATSLQFAVSDDKARTENRELLKKYIGLAHALGAPYIRVFGGEPIGIEPTGVIDYMAESLVSAVAAIPEANVEVLIETHDWFSVSRRVAKVIEVAHHPKINALWDIMHPFRHLETFEETFNNIGRHVKHLHIHDGIYLENRRKIDTCLLGEGAISHQKPMQILKEHRFNGHFSVEVIGKGEPHKVLSQYASKFREYEAALT